MYPNVKNVHLKTTLDVRHDDGYDTAGSGSTMVMKYLREVSSGPCEMNSGYGIIMAEQCGFPTATLEDAKALRSVVREKFPVLAQQQNITEAVDCNVNAINNLLQHLLLLKNSTLDTRAMQSYIQNLRNKISQETADELLMWLSVGTTVNEPSDTRPSTGNFVSVVEQVNQPIETTLDKENKSSNQYQPSSPSSGEQEGNEHYTTFSSTLQVIPVYGEHSPMKSIAMGEIETGKNDDQPRKIMKLVHYCEGDAEPLLSD
jgi:hypothetical protein